MPRDVATRWNSTYEMLDFAVQYRKPIRALTVDIRLPTLAKQQLSALEWELAAELKRALKVSTIFVKSSF